MSWYEAVLLFKKNRKNKIEYSILEFRHFMTDCTSPTLLTLGNPMGLGRNHYISSFPNQNSNFRKRQEVDPQFFWMPNSPKLAITKRKVRMMLRRRRRRRRGIVF